LLALLVVALAAAAGIAIAQSGGKDNQVGPKTRIQPSGRLLAPPGKLTTLGNHPTGGAVTFNGRFLWTLSGGRGKNDIRIVEVHPALNCNARKTQAKRRRCRERRNERTGRLVQTIAMPGVSGGIVAARDNRTVYVSGTPQSEHEDQKVAGNVPGKQGDVIHVFRYDKDTGKARRAGVIPVPPPQGTPLPQVAPGQNQITGPGPPQNFPPTNTEPLSWPRDLAVSRNGRTLLAALNLADRAAVIDTKTKAVRYVGVGSYPYGAAISRDGRGLVSNAADGTVSVIDLQTATKVKDIQVAGHLKHPEGIAADPRADRAFVAVTGEDRIAVIDTKSMTVARKLNLRRRLGLGAFPTQVAVDPYGCYLTSADSGEDALALFALRERCRITKRRRPNGRQTISVSGRQIAPRALGRVPTAAYPVASAPGPHLDKLSWVSAKGFGVGANPRGPNPTSPNDSDDKINTFQYLPSIVTGTSGVMPFPKRSQMQALSKQATAQLRPTNRAAPPKGTPIAPNAGKIKYVFYVVRENRTYDQILGDDPRGEGDPSLTLFPRKITPNAHALARRFPLLDHVFANSEASIDGHFLTSAASVSDYVVKNWPQNYGGRKRPYDFGVYSITWPSSGFLFDQAERQGISYYNYGEAIAGVVPLTDKDRGPAEAAAVAAKFQNTDLGPPAGCYPNDAYTATNAITQNEVWDSSPPPGAPPNSESRFDCFRAKFLAQLATNSVPRFNYLIQTSDHTNGVSPGRRTPRAMVAENDWALGQVVDLISHSSIWDESVILVIEDDSQDGADHVDAHRIPAFAISPYAKRGAVISNRYDFGSVIRTFELVLGMNPLNLFDALAVPMYNAFAPTRVNPEPYNAIVPNVNMTARNADTAQNRRVMRPLNAEKLDSNPQHEVDKVLWWSVHGFDSKPPPPGPNASGKDQLEEEEEGED
jgi:DNA-binding beta-propeller fold protein YncE